MRIIAPEGFLEEAVSENVLAGNAMGRRATYMYGALLPRDARGLPGDDPPQGPAVGHHPLRQPLQARRRARRRWPRPGS